MIFFSIGKIETKTENEFTHIGHNQNTQDLRAADPYLVSTKEGLHAQSLHRTPDAEKAFDTSVMKSDYKPGKK